MKRYHEFGVAKDNGNISGFLTEGNLKNQRKPWNSTIKP